MDRNVYILLPVCAETKDDLFLSIFRSIVGRTNVEKQPLHKDFVSGMKADSILIEADDVGPWNDLNSELQQSRQVNMLGFWAIKHFPSLGSRLCGDAWTPPHRKCVQVNGSDPMLPDEFDKFIFKKMNIHIMELAEVKEDTFQRLKHFVRVPAGIGKCNRTQVSNRSKNIFAFDIESVFDRQKCWHALRSGVLISSSVDEPEQTANTISFPRIDQAPLSAATSVGLRKRRRHESPTNNDGTDADDILTAECLRSMLADIQKDVRSLAQFIDRTKDNENGDLREMESLKKENLSLCSQIEANARLISALQRGSDAQYKLYAHSECQLTILQESIDKQRKVAIEKDEELATAKSTIQDLQNQLYSSGESDLKCRIVDLNQKLDQSVAEQKSLEDQCNQWKMYAETNDKKAAETSDTISDLQKKVKMSKKLIAESNAKNGMLEEELTVLKLYGNAKDKEVKEAEKMVDGLRKELDGLRSEFKSMVPKSDIDILQGKLTEATEKCGTLDEEMTVLKSYGDAKEKKVEAAERTVDGLRKELEGLQIEFKSMVPKADFEMLQRKLTEMSAKSETMDAELRVLKLYGDAKEKEMKQAQTTVDGLRKELDGLLTEFKSMVPKADVEVLQGQLTEMTAMKESIDRELTQWKICGAVKDEELKGAKTTIDSLHAKLNSVKTKVDSAIPVMNAEIKILESDLNAWKAKNQSLDEELIQWKEYGDAKDKDLKEATETIDCLRKQLEEAQFESVGLQDQLNHLNGDELTTVDKAEPCTDNYGHIDELPLPEVFSNSDPASLTDKNDVTENQGSEDEDEDIIVRKCKPVLMKQRFGWIKFTSKKNCQAWPGFIYSPDPDGYVRAQRITSDGYVSDVKNRFAHADDNIPEKEKGKAQMRALAKFNEKFKLKFV